MSTTQTQPQHNAAAAAAESVGRNLLAYRDHIRHVHFGSANIAFAFAYYDYQLLSLA